MYNSLKQNIMENRKLFQKVEILCECCGKNLLEKDSMGIFVTWLANQKSSNGKDVYQKASIFDLQNLLSQFLKQIFYKF